MERWNVVTLDGGAFPSETDPASVAPNFVDGAFFDTVDVPVIRGRGFSDEEATDDDRPVAVIGETAARQFWPDQEPLGKRFMFPAPPRTTSTKSSGSCATRVSR